MTGDGWDGPPAEVDAAALLAEVETFLARFVAYPSEHARVAVVLWVAHTHLMDSWESTPRLAFLSPEPGSGKTRAMELLELLVPRPLLSVNVSSAYLFRRVSDEAGAPTVLFDEIDTVFGPKAGEHEEVRGFLNAGHRRGATAGRCVVRGKSVETEDLPAYAAVALAGLGDLPDTILTRSVIVRMRRRAPHEQVQPFRSRVHSPAGHELRDRLAAWCAEVAEKVAEAWPEMPDGITDRPADVWEPLLAVADAAGGDWPDRARVAAVALVADTSRGEGSLGVKLLTDLYTLFHPLNSVVVEALPSATILDQLAGLEESPWADLRGKPLDARGLSRRLKAYGVTPTTVRIGDSTPKGYRAEDLHDAWARYLPSPPQGSATSATPATEPDPPPLVTEAPPAPLDRGELEQHRCAECRRPVTPSRRTLERGWATICDDCSNPVPA